MSESTSTDAYEEYEEQIAEECDQAWAEHDQSEEA